MVLYPECLAPSTNMSSGASQHFPAYLLSEAQHNSSAAGVVLWVPSPHGLTKPAVASPPLLAGCLTQGPIRAHGRIGLSPGPWPPLGGGLSLLTCLGGKSVTLGHHSPPADSAVSVTELELPPLITGKPKHQATFNETSLSTCVPGAELGTGVRS